MKSDMNETVETRFFVMGPPKTGSTTIHNSLAHHPQICMADPKETYFFDARFSDGWNLYEDRFFSHSDGEPVVGEVTPTYFFVPYAAERISKAIPDANLVTVVRDPVDRAFSDWWMNRMAGREELEFLPALRANLRAIEEGRSILDLSPGEEGRWRSAVEGDSFMRTYLEAGYYARHLDRFADLFASDQLLVLEFDTLKADGERFLQQIVKFLDLDPDWVDGPPEKSNQAVNAWALPLYRVADRLGLIGFLSTGPAALKKGIKRTIGKVGGRPSISDEATQFLLDHYSETFDRLESSEGITFDA